MVRKLAAAMLGAGVFIPGLANALGLGEIKLNSALSEPLDAEIELVQVRELTPTEILPSLAGQSDFKAADVERFHFLTDLRFEVETDNAGRPHIRVRSRKPVKEPFLNFLVEVNWPAGRLLREYTLLLDPPLYKKKQTPQTVTQSSTVTPQINEPSPTAATSSKPLTATAESSLNSTQQASSPAMESSDMATYVIQPNDGLWAIASRMKPSDNVSVQQTMMAMQRSNPDAFIDGNINLLVKGEVLRAPTEAEAMELTSREAIALAAEQNQRWKEKVAAIQSGTPTARQMDLTGESSDSGSATIQDDARLKLVSANAEDNSSSGQGGDGGSGKLQDALAIAEENVDKLKLDNQELSLKVNDLEAQLETSEKVLSLKDEQIAAMQARLRELEKLAAATPSSVDQSLEQGVVQPAEEAVDYNFAAESEQPVSSGSVETTAQSTNEQNLEVAPELDVTEPASESTANSLQDWLSNQLYLGLGAGAVLLLALGLLAARRKSENNDELEDQAEDFELPSLDDSSESLEKFDAVQLEEDAAFEEAVEASVDDRTVPQTSDVIGEADIYIAYGRFPQAIELLEKAAEQEPDRADIQLKLCEVCVEANQPETFNDHYNQLVLLGDSYAIGQADELRSKLDFSDTDFGTMSSDEFGSDLESSFDSDMSNDAVTEPEVKNDTPDYTDSLEFDLDSNDAADDLDLEQESDTGLDFDLSDLEDTGSDFATPESTESVRVEADAEAESLDHQDQGLDFELDLDTEEEAAKQSDDSAKTHSDGSELNPESDFSALDYDAPESLDFDTETSAEESKDAQAPSDPALNADSASKLADELDLDLDSDFLGETVEQDTILSDSQEIDSSLDGLDSLDTDSLAPAANDYGSTEDELDFLSDADESSTKLDLARAYIDMGDREGAKDILDEVMQEGNDDQKTEAKDLLVRLDS